MDRTPLREAFFAQAAEDPYLALIKKMYARAWVDGYEQALREARDFVFGDENREALQELSDIRSRYEREEDALEDVTDKEHRAEELVALANMGSKVEKLSMNILDRLLTQDLHGITIPTYHPNH